MKKETKVQLRQTLKAIETTLNPADLPEKHKQMALLISRAWDEGQDEKEKVQQRIDELKRLDEEEITKRVVQVTVQNAQQLDTLYKRDFAKAMEEVDEVEAHYKAAFERCTQEANRFLDWSLKHATLLEDHEFRICLCGEGADKHKALRAAVVGCWEAMSSNNLHSTYEDYKTITTKYGKVFYTFVFTPDEWRKSLITGVHNKVPAELRRYLTHVNRKK